jgi:class 3 adenylate cyclase/DNA-binding response OmpR family regulator
MNTAQGSLLIVDDDRQSRQFFAACLQSAGHITAMAENGRQALEMLRAQPFDLVLLDLLMPEMDGYQVLEHLQADDTLRHIPVLILTAADDIDSIVQCIEMGAVDCLSKPLNPLLLHARVGACLAKKHFHDQQVAYLQQLQAFNKALEQRVSEARVQLTSAAEVQAQQLREVEATSAISLALTSLMDVDELLTLIMDKSKEVMRAEASSLLMLDQEAGLLRFHVARGTAGAALRSATVALGHGIAGWVAQTGEPLLIPDAYQDPRFDPSYDQRSGFRTRSILTVPLKVKDEVTGVVQVINKIGEVAFGRHDLDLFLSFASQASVALDNARLYERTKAMAEDLRQALEQERRLTIEKEKMGAYISKQLVDEISRNREQKLALGGKTVNLTILFSDIQGFTRLSETMASQQVISFLNTYMTAMTGIIEEEGGIIDKFIGDGIMAVFTPNSEDDNHALRAVRAGVRMQKRLYSLRQELAVSRPELAGMQMRVGVNTGEVVSGNIGSETRMDYTVVGDNVNVASRLESVSRAGEVCISEATYRDIEGYIAATKLEPVYVKNRVQPVHVYTVQVVPDGEV